MLSRRVSLLLSLEPVLQKDSRVVILGLTVNFNSQQTPTRSRAVKRGLEDFVIPEGEPDTIDHLLFLVQGIGSACDLKFRGLIEVGK